jgi:hypothetical protein
MRFYTSRDNRLDDRHATVDLLCNCIEISDSGHLAFNLNFKGRLGAEVPCCNTYVTLQLIWNTPSESLLPFRQTKVILPTHYGLILSKTFQRPHCK